MYTLWSSLKGKKSSDSNDTIGITNVEIRTEKQIGLFDKENRMEKLSKLGNSLVRLNL